MAEYKCSWKPGDKMVTETSVDRDKMRVCVEHSGRPALGVLLDKDSLRALRDQINAHLGEAEKPLPVGTIVVGKGLTERQKKQLPDVNRLDAARTALSHIGTWGIYAEGHDFWPTICRRLEDVRQAVLAEKARQEEEAKKPKRTDVDGFYVKTTGTANVLLANDVTTRCLSPRSARDLAAALVKHANEAEKK